MVAPGTYAVELEADGRRWRGSFEILQDPRIEFGDAELREQYDFLITARDRLTETMDLVRRILLAPLVGGRITYGPCGGPRGSSPMRLATRSVRDAGFANHDCERE